MWISPVWMSRQSGADPDGTQQQFERRFRHEAEVASRLAHPHIVRIHEVGTDGHLVYFGMDLYPDSLGTVLAREGPLPEARCSPSPCTSRTPCATRTPSR